jgi:hypothetical protein
MSNDAHEEILRCAGSTDADLRHARRHRAGERARPPSLALITERRASAMLAQPG